MDLDQSVKDQERFDLLFDIVQQKAAAELSLSVGRGMAPLSIAWGSSVGETCSIVNDLDAFRSLPVSVMAERVMKRIRAWKAAANSN